MTAEIAVILPSFLRRSGSLVSGDLRMPATDLSELRESLRACSATAAGRLWNLDGSLRRDVVVVHNGLLVGNGGESELALSHGDEVEFLIQFAGG